MGKKLLIGCVVIFAALICLLCVIVVVISSLLVIGPLFEPSEVDIEVQIPGSVNQGDSFTVDISVTNNASIVQTLDDIDFNRNILNVIEIIGAEPPYSSSSEESLFLIYWFEKEIMSGETIDVSFEMVARHAGEHFVRIGVCINSPIRCMNFENNILVR
jgi:hypothetical protein